MCAIHGGAAPQAKAAARRREQEQAAAALVDELVWTSVDVTPVTDSLGALQRFAGQVGHATEVLGAHVGKGHVMDQAQTAAWLKVLELQRKVLTDMERLGIAQRAVELDAEMLRFLASGVDAMLDHLDVQGQTRLDAIRVLMSRLRPTGPVRPDLSTVQLEQGDQ